MELLNLRPNNLQNRHILVMDAPPSPPQEKTTKYIDQIIFQHIESNLYDLNMYIRCVKCSQNFIKPFLESKTYHHLNLCISYRNNRQYYD